MYISNVLSRYRFVVLLFIGMLIGTILFNVGASIDAAFLTKDSITFFAEDYMSMFQTVSINNELLFRHVAFSRIKLIIFLMCGCMTRYYNVWIRIAIAFMGITSGIIISCCAYSYGIVGVLIYVASIFPQWIAYVLAFVVLVKMLNQYRRDYRQMVSNLAVIVVLVAVGIYMETMINPFIIKWVYSLCSFV